LKKLLLFKISATTDFFSNITWKEITKTNFISAVGFLVKKIFFCNKIFETERKKKSSQCEKEKKTQTEFIEFKGKTKNDTIK
jgi:hypothetical protein